MDMNGQLHAAATLLPGKESLVPTGLEAGWGPETVWTRCEENKSQPCRESIPGLSQPVAQPVY